MRTWFGFDYHRFTPFTLTYSDDSCVVPHVSGWCVVCDLNVMPSVKVKVIDL